MITICIRGESEREREVLLIESKSEVFYKRKKE